MANLRVIQDQPDRLVLGRGGAAASGNALGLVIFGIVACVGLASLIDNGDVSPVTLLVCVLVGAPLLFGLLGLLSGTRVILDANRRTATRIRSLLTIPVARQELAFNLIRDVTLGRRRGPGAVLDDFPIWEVALVGSDGSTLVVNDRGTREELEPLARRVGDLLNRPVVDRAPAAVPTPEMAPARASLLSVLNESLAYGRAPGEASASLFGPTPAAGSEPPRRARQRSAARSRPAPPPTPPARPVPAPSVPQPTADAMSDPFSAYVPDRSSSMSTVESFPQLGGPDAFNAPPVGYSAPPVLILPTLPGFPSLGPGAPPASFAPLDATAPSQATSIPDLAEIKEVEARVSATAPRDLEGLQRAIASDPTDMLSQYRLARLLQSARDGRAARTAYERALGINPADAGVQNDYGVLLTQLNRYQDAERALRRAVALDPNSAAARYNLGFVLARLGQRAGAFEQFKLGLQQAGRDEAELFEQALEGVLRAPVPSPEP